MTDSADRLYLTIRVDRSSTIQSPEGRRAPAELLLIIVAWGIVAWALWRLVESPAASQWDLIVYRRAGAVFAGGGDPYARGGTELPFVYPPVMLPIFEQLARVKGVVIYWIWLAAKVVAIAVWVRTANLYFEPFSHRANSLFFLIFSFNGAIYVDLLAGNVTIFEQAFLWAAMGSLIQRRLSIFTLLVVAAAQLKLTPVLLLPLLLVVPERRAWRWLLIGGGAMVASLTLQMLIWPTHFAAFTRQATGLHEIGHLNPSSYAVASTLVGAIPGTGIANAGAGLYVLFVAAVATWAGRVWMKGRAWLRANPAWAICFAVCVYAVLLPRFKNYSYILLIIPAWMAIHQIEVKRWSWLAVAAVLPQPATFLPTGGLVAEFGQYLPWIAAFGLTLVIGQHVLARAADPTAAISATSEQGVPVTPS